AAERRPAVGVLAGDLVLEASLPVADVDLLEAVVELRGQAERGADDVRSLRGADEWARVERDEAVPLRGLGQRPGLLAPGVVERHVLLALEPAVLVVGRLTMAGKPDHDSTPPPPT